MLTSASRRQSDRATARLTRLAAAHRRVHEAEERAAAIEGQRFYLRLRDRVLSRLDRGTFGQYGFPGVDELLQGDDNRNDFYRFFPQRLRHVQTVGVEFEQSHLESGNSQAASAWGAVQQKRSPTDLRINMSPEMEAAISDWLKTRTPGVWSSINTTTHAKLVATLTAGLKAHDNLKAMQARIQTELTGYSAVAARRLARTETTGAMSHGAQVARVDSAVEFKAWCATLDSQTRTASNSGFEHYGNNGQIVPNLDPFIISGERLMYPGDSSAASAGNCVNCRCSGISSFQGPAVPPAAPPPAATPPQPPKKPKAASKPLPIGAGVKADITEDDWKALVSNNPVQPVDFGLKGPDEQKAQEICALCSVRWHTVHGLSLTIFDRPVHGRIPC